MRHQIRPRCACRIAAATSRGCHASRYAEPWSRPVQQGCGLAPGAAANSRKTHARAVPGSKQPVNAHLCLALGPHRDRTTPYESRVSLVLCDDRCNHPCAVRCSVTSFNARSQVRSLPGPPNIQAVSQARMVTGTQTCEMCGSGELVLGRCWAANQHFCRGLSVGSGFEPGPPACRDVVAVYTRSRPFAVPAWFLELRHGVPSAL
jgi:hypothetical protein